MVGIFYNDNDNGNDDDDDDEINQVEAYNPSSHMRNLYNALIDQSSSVLLYEDQTLPVDAGIEKGMTFHSKEECVRAI
ncbi:hypothetical protein A2U01_0066633, partial [Trifolium medium]|nr:hypothetical protein [Trifolium medium]